MPNSIMFRRVSLRIKASVRNGDNPPFPFKQQFGDEEDISVDSRSASTYLDNVCTFDSSRIPLQSPVCAARKCS